MVVALGIWLYIAALSWLYGWFTLAGLGKLAGFKLRPLPPFGIVALVGLGCLSTLLGLFALVSSIGLVAHLVLVGLAGAVVIRSQTSLRCSIACYVARARGTGRGVLALFLVGALIILERTTEPVANSGTGLYHAQAIRWLEEFGIVTGLGNLHGRLAFSVAWFLPSALFGLSFAGLRSFHVLNGALLLLFFAFAIGGLEAWRAGERRPSSAVGVGLAFAGLILCGSWLSSPTTDIPAAVLVWVAGLLYLQKLEHGSLEVFDWRAAAIVILAVYAVAVKLSVLPILVLPLALFASCRAWRSRRAALIPAIALIVLTPPVVQSVLTSGYPFYPFPKPELDLFGFDWKVPSELVVEDLSWIASWSRIPGQPYQEVLAMPLAEWLPIWSSQLPRTERVALLGVLALAPIFLGYLGRRLAALGSTRAKLERLAGPFVLVATLYLGVAFWFLTAPDPRFSWGFLILLAVLLGSWAIAPLLRRLPYHILALVLIVAIAHQARAAYRAEGGSIDRLVARAVLPPDYPPAEIVVMDARNFRVLVPTDGWFCWYATLPCTPMPPTTIELRGATLRDGFRSHGPSS